MNRGFIGALCLSVACALLASCGGPQAAIGGPGAMTQGHEIAQDATRVRSWMSPEAKNDDLVYVSFPRQNLVSIYAYPTGQLVGSLTDIPSPYGMCTDRHGHVFVTSWSSESGPTSIIEYAHAGSQPIATLSDGDNAAAQCSVDRTTGNLAAGNLNFNIAVWPHAQGSPTYYSTQGFIEENWTITYDASGNLYFASLRFRRGQAWLPRGSSAVARFYVPKNGFYGFDGRYLTIRAKAKSGETVARYALSGPTGKKLGYLKLNSCFGLEGYAIDGSSLVAACSNSVSFYKYPAGGNSINAIDGLNYPYGVAISRAPH